MSNRETIKEKTKTVSVQLNNSEKEFIETKGIGNTFSKKMKSLISFPTGKESPGIIDNGSYNAGYRLGKFYGQNAELKLQEIILSEELSIKFNLITKLCVDAKQEIPLFLVDMLNKNQMSSELYLYLLGISIGIIEGKK
jgi:hypothetical protein